MKKYLLSIIRSLPIVVIGLCSCSSSDEDNWGYVPDIPIELLNQTTTEFTGDEWYRANVGKSEREYKENGELKMERDCQGAITYIWFGDTPAEERPKTVAEFYEKFYGKGVADYFKCTQHIEWMTDMHEYYQQYYKGIKVMTEAKCIGFRDGLMLFASCDYLPVKDFNVVPKYSKLVAIEIFKSFMKLDAYDEISCELQIARVPVGDSFGPRLAYEVKRRSQGLLIDANSGRVLYKTYYDYMFL